jgi:hemin uptake protein HemP
MRIRIIPIDILFLVIKIRVNPNEPDPATVSRFRERYSVFIFLRSYRVLQGAQKMNTSSASADAAASVATPVEVRLSSDDLFRNTNLVFIDHDGTTYSLRKTKNGKLILTK